ncbi:MAG TPA: HlyD family efflux transporter periplasmic adaptor subunit [Bryobacteraceae bacterium]|nr:HlyD family efflux transporter periplasmic adaptor subunit [Bryobacteraceae bacterium]
MPKASDPSPETNGVHLEVSPKPPALPPGRRRWVAWLVVIGILAAGWAAYLFAKRPAQTAGSAVQAVPTAVIRTGSVERSLRITGQTTARNFASITVTSFRGQPGMGRGGNLVLTTLAEGGSMVKTGDVVAELDTESMLTTIDDMKASNEQAELEIERLKAQQALDWESLQQTVRSAKANYDRAALDFKKAEVLTPIEQELLRLALEQAEAVYKQQLFSLDFKKTSLAAVMRISELSLDRLRLRFERTLNDMKTFTFRAPMDGMVVLQSLERSGGSQAQYAAGDAVNPGRSFMKIVDLSSMQLDGLANQTASSELRVGQTAVVTLDAFPELTFPATIYSVGAMARSSRMESFYFRTVPVVVQIEGQHPRLLPDMSGAADVLLESEQNTPLVPLEAIHSEEGRTFVYVRVPTGFEKRFVEVGVRSAAEGAVLSGLQAGDVVALAEPPPAAGG